MLVMILRFGIQTLICTDNRDDFAVAISKMTNQIFYILSK